MVGLSGAATAGKSRSTHTRQPMPNSSCSTRSPPFARLVIVVSLAALCSAGCTPAPVVVVAAAAPAAAAEPGIAALVVGLLVLAGIVECSEECSSGSRSRRPPSRLAPPRRAERPRATPPRRSQPAAVVTSRPDQTVNVRSAPSRFASRIGEVERGRPVTIIDQRCDARHGYTMARISYAEQGRTQTGWVVRYLLSPAGATNELCCAGHRFVRGCGCADSRGRCD